MFALVNNTRKTSSPSSGVGSSEISFSHTMSLRYASTRKRLRVEFWRLLPVGKGAYLPMVQDIVLGEVRMYQATPLVHDPYQLQGLRVAPALPPRMTNDVDNGWTREVVSK